MPPVSEELGGRGLVGVGQPNSPPRPRPLSRFIFYSALELVPESDETRFQIQTYTKICIKIKYTCIIMLEKYRFPDFIVYHLKCKVITQTQSKSFWIYSAVNDFIFKKKINEN